MKYTAQNASILRHLKRGLYLDPLLALHQYKCFRLAARIKDLRNVGHEIKTEIVNQGGHRIARYRLAKSS